MSAGTHSAKGRLGLIYMHVFMHAAAPVCPWQGCSAAFACCTAVANASSCFGFANTA
jgi:hypothetical protein